MGILQALITHGHMDPIYIYYATTATMQITNNSGLGGARTYEKF